MIDHQPWSPADEARLRELRAQGKGRQEIAAALGRTVPSVSGRLQKLGLSERKQPDWTAVDDARLDELLGRHVPYAEIARRLGRSVNAIIIRCKRKGYERLRARAWTLSEVARQILGSRQCQKTVAWWVRMGWLRAVPSGLHTNSPRVTVPVHVVEHDDLVAFLGDERYWHLWDPERIADRRLRELTMELRRGKRFLRVGEVAQRLGHHQKWINTCINLGRIPAVKHGPNWLVREDWLPGIEKGRGARTMPVIQQLSPEEREALLRRALERDKLRAWLLNAEPGKTYSVTLEDGDDWQRLPHRLGQYARQFGFQLTWLKEEATERTRYFEVHERKTKETSITDQPPPPSATESAAVTDVGPATPAPAANPLSERETKVLELLAADLDYKEIAARLQLSTGTVTTYASTIRHKLGVESTAAAIELAVARGWIPQPPPRVDYAKMREIYAQRKANGQAKYHGEPPRGWDEAMKTGARHGDGNE